MSVSPGELAVVARRGTGRSFVAAAAAALFPVITLLKGKVWKGLVGIYLTPLALVGAVRLGRPGSPWARWRYNDGSRKLRRAERREKKIPEPMEPVPPPRQQTGRPAGGLLLTRVLPVVSSWASKIHDWQPNPHVSAGVGCPAAIGPPGDSPGGPTLPHVKWRRPW